METSIKKLLEIEKLYKMYDMCIDGCAFWVYYRFYFWNNVIFNAKINNNSKQQKKKINKMVLYANKFLNFIKYFLIDFIRIKKANILFVNHPRRVRINGIYKCIYTDKLVENYTNSIVFEKTFNGRHFKPTNTKNLIYSDFYDFIVSFVCMFIKFVHVNKCRQIKQKIEGCINECIHDIEEKYDLKLNRFRIINDLYNIILKHKIAKIIYKKMVVKINPKVIVEVVGYSFHQMLINEIAKELKILTIELQHGNINNNHISYQYNTNKTIKQLPDKMFVFSAYWKQQIRLPIERNNIVATGFPYMEEMVEKFPKKKHNKRTILFIPQPNISICLADLAFELSKLLPVKDYRILYKMHPGDTLNTANVVSILSNSNVEIICKGNESIYKYFSISDIQIGVYSTALYEGMMYDLLTLIYKVSKYKDMYQLVDSGYAYYISNVQDVIDIIDKKSEKSIKIKEELNIPNALNNIIENINIELVKN